MGHAKRDNETLTLINLQASTMLATELLQRELALKSELITLLEALLIPMSPNDHKRFTKEVERVRSALGEHASDSELLRRRSACKQKIRTMLREMRDTKKPV